jgi:predicted RNA polymerase sigma factor
MAAMKVPDTALLFYLDAGHSQADAARHFAVSEAAIHQRLKRMKRLTSQVVALEQAGAVVEEKLTATARLERIQQVIDEELVWAVEQARREGADRGALADVILKLAGEVRQQLHLQLQITRTLIDLREMREFRQTVVDIISEEAPDIGRRLLARLKDRRVLRLSADLLPALDDGGGTNGYPAA